MADFDPHKIPYRFGMMDFLTAVFLIATPTSVTMSLTDNGGAAIGMAIAALVFTAPGLIWGASIADVFEIKSAWKRALIQIGSFVGFVAVASVIPSALVFLATFSGNDMLKPFVLSGAALGASLSVCHLMLRLDARRIYLLRKRHMPDLPDGF